MATFPSYATAARESSTAQRRTDTGVKTVQFNSSAIQTIQSAHHQTIIENITLLLTSAEYLSLRVWVDIDIARIGSFDYTPVGRTSTVTATLVGGGATNVQPVDRGLVRWRVGLAIRWTEKPPEPIYDETGFRPIDLVGVPDVGEAGTVYGVRSIESGVSAGTLPSNVIVVVGDVNYTICEIDEGEAGVNIGFCTPETVDFPRIRPTTDLLFTFINPDGEATSLLSADTDSTITELQWPGATIGWGTDAVGQDYTLRIYLAADFQ